ncbi:MAG: hypothetical protein JSR78_05475 [Proteobacteria bacterium]|nr:hypothetical protein [Pseudomonadota bacterium]
MRTAAVSKSQNLWVESTVAGIERLARARSQEAAYCWLEAEAVQAARGTEFDSLRAASRSNAAAARLLLRHEHEAELNFEAADQAWQNVIAGVATLDVPMSGASSSFHFRLAAKAPDVLISAGRQRYRRLAEAALAITQFNRALIGRRSQDAAHIAERATGLKAMLCDVLGHTSPEARLLSVCIEPDGDGDVCAIYAGKLQDISARQRTLSAASSEACANLESAVALTALLTPAILNAIDRSVGDSADDPNQQLELE